MSPSCGISIFGIHFQGECHSSISQVIVVLAEFEQAGASIVSKMADPYLGCQCHDMQLS